MEFIVNMQMEINFVEFISESCLSYYFEHVQYLYDEFFRTPRRENIVFQLIDVSKLLLRNNVNVVID